MPPSVETVQLVDDVVYGTTTGTSNRTTVVVQRWTKGSKREQNGTKIKHEQTVTHCRPPIDFVLLPRNPTMFWPVHISISHSAWHFWFVPFLWSKWRIRVCIVQWKPPRCGWTWWLLGVSQWDFRFLLATYALGPATVQFVLLIEKSKQYFNISIFQSDFKYDKQKVFWSMKNEKYRTTW